jgi:hypothetical protein
MLALLCFRTLHSCAFSMRRWLKISLFDPYRPELHYMRGPGPKWREKQFCTQSASGYESKNGK